MKEKTYTRTTYLLIDGTYQHVEREFTESELTGLAKMREARIKAAQKRNHERSQAKDNKNSKETTPSIPLKKKGR